MTIGAVAVVVALAVGIFVVVFNQTREKNAAADALAPFTPSETNPDPSTTIPGIYVGASTPATAETPAGYVDYKAAIHITADQRVAYNRFPPVGGPHDGEWANCNGIVYTTAVRNENMVHTLEHGAVWIAYNPETISQEDLTTLTGLVQGKPYMSLSPYPGLDATISLQAWAHQLKLDSASDPRVEQFITALRQNRWVYPETGATCQQPTFDVGQPAAVRCRPRPVRTPSRWTASARPPPPASWPLPRRTNRWTPPRRCRSPPVTFRPPTLRPRRPRPPPVRDDDPGSTEHRRTGRR